MGSGAYASPICWWIQLGTSILSLLGTNTKSNKIGSVIILAWIRRRFSPKEKKTASVRFLAYLSFSNLLLSVYLIIERSTFSQLSDQSCRVTAPFQFFSQLFSIFNTIIFIGATLFHHPMSRYISPSSYQVRSNNPFFTLFFMVLRYQ